MMNGNLNLRQTYSAGLNFLYGLPDIYTIAIPVLNSTFNKPNATYTIVVDDNFALNPVWNEPLNGIEQGIWTVSTEPFKQIKYAGTWL